MQYSTVQHRFLQMLRSYNLCRQMFISPARQRTVLVQYHPQQRLRRYNYRNVLQSNDRLLSNNSTVFYKGYQVTTTEDECSSLEIRRLTCRRAVRTSHVDYISLF